MVTRAISRVYLIYRVAAMVFVKRTLQWSSTYLLKLIYSGFISTEFNNLLVIASNKLERFSIECRKTKTKVITTANQNKGKYHKEPIRTQSEYREPLPY